MCPISNGQARDVLLEALQTAIQAPSGHNTQPWRFVLYDDAVDLYADRSRALPVSDPHDRELIMSCGCALLSLRIAVAAYGYVCMVKTFPGNSHADLLARVTISPAALPEEDGFLEPSISSRRTYRRSFDNKAISAAIRSSLIDAAFREHCDLQFFDELSQRSALATLVSEADAMQWENPDWRRELAGWIRPRRHGDGIAVNSLLVPVTRSMIRNFDLGQRVSAKNRELFEASPLLAVISTSGDTPTHWLAAGQALQRVLLDAVHQGLQASYFNQAVQVPLLRTKLQHMLRKPNFPQVFLRLGFPIDTLPPTPRRPLADVLSVN